MKVVMRSLKIKFASAEMLTFVRYFALMVGDYVPRNDPVWEFFLIFREIVDIVTAPTVNRNIVEYLRVLITEHHEMYTSLFDDNLKPKHHYMIHYPDLMLILGPLINIWSTRWESAHRPPKQYAHLTNSRVDLPKTLAIKMQLKLCYRLFSRKQFVKKPVWGPRAFNGASLHVLDNYPLFFSKLPSALRQSGTVTIRWIEIKGTKYEHNMVVVLGFRKELPRFGIIKYIVPADSDAYFVTNLLKTVGFDQHFYAYVVQNTDRWTCILQKDLYTYQPQKLIVVPRTGRQMITTRFKL